MNSEKNYKKMKSHTNELDGSILEGGGQVIRISFGLSASLNESIKVFNIRAGRSKPGLKAQHMNGLNLLHKMMGGKNGTSLLEGCVLNSTQVTFEPHVPSKIDEHEHFSIDVGTAGATTLVSQLVFPVALFRPSKSVLMDLKGGTDVNWSPSIEYYKSIFGELVKKFGACPFDTEILKRGYFPKGGGHIQLKIKPMTEPLKAVNLTEPGNLTAITIFANSAGKVPKEVASKMASSACQHLVSQGLKQEIIQIVTQYFDHNQAFANGSTIFIKAETSTGIVLGSSAISSPKIKPENVGKNAAQTLFEYIDQGVCLDEYAQDQVIIFMALAKGCSKVLTGPLTLHTQTAIHVVEHLTKAQFKVSPVSEEKNNSKFIIECQGIGLEPSSISP